VLAVDSINSRYTYYNTVNKRIPITANKRIHIISAYFLAAASDKHMHLLTSLYGIININKETSQLAGKGYKDSDYTLVIAIMQ